MKVKNGNTEICSKLARKISDIVLVFPCCFEQVKELGKLIVRIREYSCFAKTFFSILIMLNKKSAVAVCKFLEKKQDNVNDEFFFSAEEGDFE